MKQNIKNMELKLVLNMDITKEVEGQYISLPFDVPEKIQQISIHLKVNGDKDNIIDLGLEGPDGMKGWSGGARKSIFIREDRATPGYVLEEIKNGTWGVVLNAYRIEGDCQVEVEVVMQPESPKWIKGDLHMHSNHSDSPYTLSEVITNAKEAGLEYIALTDHNTFSQNTAFEPQEDLVIIPAVELTTNRGHSNFYGVNRPFSDFRCQSVDDVKRVIREGENNEALISVNHPHCDHCWWDWGLENFEFQFIEIWNGPWKESNLRTLNWWQKELEKGKRVIAIGGSDKHGPHESIKYGGPTTVVQASVHSPNGILDAIRLGRVCVSANPNGPVINLKLNGKSMGDTVILPKKSSDLVLEIFIENCIDGTLKVFSSEGLAIEKEIQARNGDYNIQLKSDALFYRVELWCEDNQLKEAVPQAISNPIFIK